jgi:hypothetical protein
MKRGNAFLINDDYLRIHDVNPKPSYELKGEERVEAGANALKELFQFENDENWEKALQLVANQTSLNSIFDSPILMFNISAAEAQWNDPISREDHVLKAAFPDNLPPIGLKIIRNPTSGEIEKVQVEVEGFLDIIDFQTSGKEEEKKAPKMVAEKAIKGSLTYTVTLNEDARPIISALHSEFQGQ